MTAPSRFSSSLSFDNWLQVYQLPLFQARLNQLQRPELTTGTVDFAVDSSEEYWSKNPPPQISMPYHSVKPPPDGSREPEPLEMIFAFDVSSEAVALGFLKCACAFLKELLYVSHLN